MPTAELLRLAEILDGAGFAYLEVSGGGVLRHGGAPRRREPVGADPRAERAHARRRSRWRCAAASSSARGRSAATSSAASSPQRGRERDRRLPPPRPAERRREPARGGRGDQRGRQGVRRRARLQLRLHGRDRGAGRAGAQAARARRGARAGPRPVELARSRSVRASSSSTLAEASGLPVGLYCQGAGGNALAAALEAARAGADLDRLRGLPGRAHRCTASPARRSRPRSSGLGLDTGVDVAALWRASELVDEHIGDEPVTPLAPRIAVRAAEHKLPRRPRRRARRRTCARTPPATGSTRCSTSSRGSATEVGWPPLASPIGQMLGSQALLHVLGASATGPSSTSCAT